MRPVHPDQVVSQVSHPCKWIARTGTYYHHLIVLISDSRHDGPLNLVCPWYYGERQKADRLH